MKELKGNENFLCINQCVNIFDIVKCKETQASQIIAWLLNPREAHNWGKKFFADFLDAISSPKAQEIQGYTYTERNTKEASKTKKELKDAYKDVVIQTEYNIHVKIKENYIDILLCLEQAKSIFVIENKYGAKEHNEQTQKYYKHFSKAQYKGYTIFYVYLDVYNYYGKGRYTLADSTHWKMIDYTWIINSLEQYLKQKNKNSEIAKIMHDIYIEFSGDYKRERHFAPYYEQESKILAQYEGEGLSKYNITQNRGKYDIQHYNYRNFYDAINDVSFWERYLDINDDYIYEFDNKKFKCAIGRSKMYLTPIAIDQKYQVLKATSIEKIHWPIYCTLEYKDNQINYKLEYPKNNLKHYFDNSDALKLGKKKELPQHNAKGSCQLKDLSKKLNDFLSVCSESFLIIQKEISKK